MAAPSFTDSSTNVTTATNSSPSTSLVINKPSAVANGDLMLMQVTVDGPVTITPPSGWSTIYNSSNGTVGAAAFYKRAGASEPSSYTVTTGSDESCGAIFRITGTSEVGIHTATTSQGTAQGVTSTATNDQGKAPAGAGAFVGTSESLAFELAHFHDQDNAGSEHGPSHATSVTQGHTNGFFGAGTCQQGAARFNPLKNSTTPTAISPDSVAWFIDDEGNVNSGLENFVLGTVIIVGGRDFSPISPRGGVRFAGAGGPGRGGW